jgi:hypothetical protein
MLLMVSLISAGGGDGGGGGGRRQYNIYICQVQQQLLLPAGTTTGDVLRCWVAVARGGTDVTSVNLSRFGHAYLLRVIIKHTSSQKCM